MSCETLTPERVQRVIQGRVTPDEMALLQGHLSTHCEACLDRLADVDGEELLRAIGEGGLTASESEAIYSASVAAAASSAAAAAAGVTRGPFSRARRALYVSVALAASIAAIAIAGSWVQRASMRDKGEGTPSIELYAFVGKKIDGRPILDRRWAIGDRLKPGEEVLFRYRLDAPAHVYLLVKSVRGVELAYTSAAQVASGERELAEEGRALSLEPAGLGADIEVIAVASPHPVPTDRWLGLKELSDEVLAEICSSCGATRLRLTMEVIP